MYGGVARVRPEAVVDNDNSSNFTYILGDPLVRGALYSSREEGTGFGTDRHDVMVADSGSLV